MRVAAEIHVAPPPVGDVRVELGRPEIRVAEHLLDAAQVRSTFQQMGCEGVPQQVGMNALRLEPGAAGEAA